MKYIWDTNIVIYYLNEGLNANAVAFIDNIPEESKPTIIHYYGNRTFGLA